MFPHPPYRANGRGQKSHESADALLDEVDALAARLDRADALVAEALRREPVDWEAHYHELLTDAAAAGRARAARMESGA